MNSRYLAPVRVNPVVLHSAEKRLSLSGEWRFRLDPDDKGLQQGWSARTDGLKEAVQVPGSWQGQGFGGDGKDTLWDFQLSARTFRATYRGTAWYARTFSVPEEWNGKSIWLNFGGAHPSAEVWLDGLRLGENSAPFVPFGFEITGLVSAGREHEVVVRVHEQDRELGLAFNWQGNWSGLYRDVELTAAGSAFLERLWIHPDVDRQALRIRARIGGLDASTQGVVLQVSAKRVGQHGDVRSSEQPVSVADLEFEVPIESPDLWSPDAPNLYRVDAALVRGDQVLDAQSERVGFVKLSTQGKHFLINGEPYYMRGSGDFQAQPETGCPDTDRERWRRKLGTLRDYGYNYVRCQSHVPFPEYFDAADEVGLLVQSEMGMLGAWAGSGPWHGYYWPMPDPQYRDKLKGQWDRVVMRDVNHPSANIYCMSNELGAELFCYPRVAWQCYHDTKAIKPTAMVIWTDGGYRPDAPQDFVCPWRMDLKQCDKPIIEHEFKWWSSYPDVRIMHKYSGALRPYAQQIAIEAARQHAIEHVLPRAAHNSQRLQLLEAKGKMEGCRRDGPDLAGICHFNAMDANPSPQGIVDEFYERKIVDAATWRQTNGDTVILSSLGFDDRVLAPGETLRCDLSVSDFTHPPFTAPTIQWEVAAGGRVLGSGRIQYAHQPFTTCQAAALKCAIGDLIGPVKAHLKAVLLEGSRSLENVWDLWLFPQGAPLPEMTTVYGEARHTWIGTVQSPKTVEAGTPVSIREASPVLTEVLDPVLLGFMRAGGRVVLAASEGLVRPFHPKLHLTQGRYFFTPPANYPPYEDGNNGTIIQGHPMLGDFPHEGFADLSFYRMLAEWPPLPLEPLGLNGADPVIRAMHSYPVARSLGYLVECSVGAGGLILCALNLDQALPEGRHLLAQISAYAAGNEFAPTIALTDEALQVIVAGTALP